MGKHSTYTWDKSVLEEEAITWNDETVVNWSEVGKRYDIRDKSGKVAKKLWPDCQGLPPEQGGKWICIYL